VERSPGWRCCRGTKRLRAPRRLGRRHRLGLPRFRVRPAKLAPNRRGGNIAARGGCGRRARPRGLWVPETLQTATRPVRTVQRRFSSDGTGVTVSTIRDGQLVMRNDRWMRGEVVPRDDRAWPRSSLFVSVGLALAAVGSGVDSCSVLPVAALWAWRTPGTKGAANVLSCDERMSGEPIGRTVGVEDHPPSRVGGFHESLLRRAARVLRGHQAVHP
jgi:hypothetical protein